ncbi:hypothetical protein PL373_13200 [Tenacibaculum maritimum]|nr:hypothetical protein [Tenacibaculum maritimum]MDB0600318.1 hypothetical protein [Tenacibaculum maritimum]MDB0602086.1 hypothetical protein [Tenacibaculum maritimum]MDB0610828.1 hypothetical protein [Tenacibaculum maritimum]
MKEINIPFNIGQVVFLKTDDEQKKHFVTGIKIRQGGVVYSISHNGYEVDVFDFEISVKENVLIKLGIDEK